MLMRWPSRPRAVCQRPRWCHEGVARSITIAFSREGGGGSACCLVLDRAAPAPLLLPLPQVGTLQEAKGSVAAATEWLLGAGILPGPAPDLNDLLGLGGTPGAAPATDRRSYLDAAGPVLPGAGQGVGGGGGGEGVLGGMDGASFEDKVGRLVEAFEVGWCAGGGAGARPAVCAHAAAGDGAWRGAQLMGAC